MLNVTSPGNRFHVVIAMGDRLKVLHGGNSKSSDSVSIASQVTTLYHSINQNVQCLDVSGGGNDMQVAAGVADLCAGQCKVITEEWKEELKEELKEAMGFTESRSRDFICCSQVFMSFH